MEKLSYATLHGLGYDGYLLEEAPERFIQFGEGNFLRAFVDYFIDVANEKCGLDTKAVLIQPIDTGRGAELNEQEGLYTLYLRGIKDEARVEEKRVISCVSRCLNQTTQFSALLGCAGNPDLRFIVSNTTEAGIVFRPADTLDGANTAAFPGALTRFLYERFVRFHGAPDKGFVLLPCELIENNGEALRGCVRQYIDHWGLEPEFTRWVDSANSFCSTLVDRIVPGYPADGDALDTQNGYSDSLKVTGEPFALWVIEGPERLKEELPFAKAGLPVLVTKDHSPYKERKVRILNGAHTTLACAALLSGVETVGESMDDALLREYLRGAVYDEIIPTLSLPRAELLDFAASVEERFRNPAIRHELLSITLNVTSKWRARVLPSVLGYAARFQKLPPLLTFSFAAYIDFMSCGGYPVKDDREVLDFFAAHQGEEPGALLRALCARTDFWGQDLSALEGFEESVAAGLNDIAALGTRPALEKRMKGAAAV